MSYKYTVIIPHYNNINGLNKLLSTIPSKNYVEVIIVDDNSHSKVTDYIDEFMVKHYENLTVLTNESGYKGAGAARNIGIKHAKGEFIIFADSDDYFVDNAFDTICSGLKKDCDICYFKPTSFCLVEKEKSDRHVRYAKLIDNYLQSECEDIRYKFYVPWSKVFRRKFLVENNVRFDEVLASNDVMFSLVSGSKANKISVLDEVFYCVTRGVGTLTVNRSKEVVFSRVEVALRESSYIINEKINTENHSVISVFNLAGDKIDPPLALSTLFAFSKGHLPFFPQSYKNYIKNPRLILNRILSKPVVDSSKSSKYKKYSFYCSLSILFLYECEMIIFS
ncbi:glycosyltransferase family 2 protein [Shewanella sp. 10N.286.48.B5]|uniref:glycosyltransferase family 2 protein n=1 Tax=Shewanella sp. 10N.286.48.B5 TaxID=1880834 RepID=UPI000C86071C|nr:glycosyltransferase family A protein [Shewanella sp. 10N.286.48.B5]PMH86654.1 hypothetical protein BCU57_10990 [Shewanella sp. 10N.286.48.B5]